MAAELTYPCLILVPSRCEESWLFWDSVTVKYFFAASYTKCRAVSFILYKSLFFLCNSGQVACIYERIRTSYNSICAFCTFSLVVFKACLEIQFVILFLDLKLQHSGDWKWNCLPRNRSLLCWPDNEELFCTTGCCLLVRLLRMSLFLEKHGNFKVRFVMNPPFSF